MRVRAWRGSGGAWPWHNHHRWYTGDAECGDQWWWLDEDDFWWAALDDDVRFDDDDNVREMIVRAMTSESGEMCNLEDVRAWPGEQGQEIDFNEKLKIEPRLECTAEKLKCKTDNQWPIHKNESLPVQLGGRGRAQWLLELVCDMCGNESTVKPHKFRCYRRKTYLPVPDRNNARTTDASIA